MTTTKLMLIVAKRGLSIILNNGRPELVRPAGNKGVTDALLAVLKRHRERIIEMLSAQPAPPTPAPAPVATEPCRRCNGYGTIGRKGMEEECPRCRGKAVMPAGSQPETRLRPRV